jgi:hypothetical protein
MRLFGNWQFHIGAQPFMICKHLKKDINKTMKQLFAFILLLALLPSCKKEKIEDPLVKSCFGYQPDAQNEKKVRFTNCSENALSYKWNFGDGTTSNESEPTHEYSGSFPFYVTLIAYHGSKSDTITRRLFDEIMVYKPNIYIYPLHKTRLCVGISFPMGGDIVESIPEYGDGWCVDIDINGKINGKYDYLFYESKQPNIFQYEKGWCIGRADLKSFFEKNMAQYNFSSSEIRDFIDYWMPLLTEDNFYCIYPQTNEIIDKIIRLDLSVKPDKIYRLFYGVIGTSEFKKLEAPKIKSFDRNGFYIVEWGVFRN